MIGIFDSGFGGLTVMKEYLQRYPEYDYVYLADKANSPYGNKSQKRLEGIIIKNVDFLVKQGCKLIIFACNTASAEALRTVQGIYKGDPAILGVIIPTVEEALQISKGKIGVIGTRGTIQSKAYEREIHKLKPEAEVIGKPCPLLVSLIEEGFIHHTVTRMVLKKYLSPLKNAHVDTLILGCTHYPLLEKDIQRIMGKNCKLLSSSKAAVDAIETYFERHAEIEKALGKNGKRIYYTTDDPARFEEMGSDFLGQKFHALKAEIHADCGQDHSLDRSSPTQILSVQNVRKQPSSDKSASGVKGA
jgi:glutamate racemase